MPHTLEGRPAARRPLGRRDMVLRAGRAGLSTGAATASRNAGGQVPAS